MWRQVLTFIQIIHKNSFVIQQFSLLLSERDQPANAVPGNGRYYCEIHTKGVNTRCSRAQGVFMIGKLIGVITSGLKTLKRPTTKNSPRRY